MSDYINFDEAAKALELDADGLKRMVAEGEIRAFRDSGETVFKPEDVERLKSALGAQPIIIPPTSGSDDIGLLDDELETVLNIEGLGEINIEEELEAASNPNITLDNEATVIGEFEDDDEEETFVVIEDDEPSSVFADTVASTGSTTRDTITLEEDTSVDDNTLMLTEDDIGDETESLELLTETSTVMEEEQSVPGMGEAEGFGFATTPSHRGASADRPDPLGSGLLIATALVMLVGLCVCIGIITGNSNPIIDLLG